MATKQLNTFTFLSTLNAALIIVGFAVITTLFLPLERGSSELSQKITIPFRAVSLLIALYVLLRNFTNAKINKYNILLVAFFMLYIIKLFWHITCKEDTAAVQFENLNQYYLLTIGVIFIPVLSLICSWDKINMRMFLGLVLISGFFVLFISMSANNARLTSGREMANMALRSIAYGHFAVSIALVSLYALLYGNFNKIIYSSIFFVVFLFSVYIALRAGSRSPIIALIIVSTIIIIFSTKSKIKAILVILILPSLFIIFIDDINNLSSSFSVINDRMELMSKGDSNGRDILIKEGWKQFIEHPFVGGDFVIASGPAKGGYPHNIIIEAFMVLGIFGGLLVILIFIALFQSIKLVKEKNIYALFGILYMQHLIYRMFSLGIYSDNVFFCLLTIVLSTIVNKKFNEQFIYKK